MTVSQGQTINYNPMTTQTPPPYRPATNYNVHSPNLNRSSIPPPQYLPPPSPNLQVPSEINHRVSLILKFQFFKNFV